MYVTGFIWGEHYTTFPLPHTFDQHPYHLLTQVTNPRLTNGPVTGEKARYQILAIDLNNKTLCYKIFKTFQQDTTFLSPLSLSLSPTLTYMYT